jgi:hypothetical protein
VHISIDTWLWILAGAIPLGMGALGGHVSSNNKRLKFTFWFLGILGLLVVIVAGIRNQQAQDSFQQTLIAIEGNTQKNLHTHALFISPYYVETKDQHHPSLKVGKVVSVNVIYTNSGDRPLNDVKMGAVVLILPFNFSYASDDQRQNFVNSEWRQYEGTVSLGNTEGAVSPNTGYRWHTYESLPLTDADEKGLTIYPPKEAVCVLSKLDWKDDTGHYETDYFSCSVLEDQGGVQWHGTSFTNHEQKLKEQAY